jgi:hypothetical protein
MRAILSVKYDFYRTISGDSIPIPTDHLTFMRPICLRFLRSNLIYINSISVKIVARDGLTDRQITEFK